MNILQSNTNPTLELSLIKVGIIICARNVEAWLEACLISCIHGRTLPTEIHLINDGSTDHTQEVYDRFRTDNLHAVDVTFHLYETSGVGPGAARNLVLDKIRTDIVAFVDADDLICRETLDEVARGIMTSGADVGLGGVSMFSARSGNVWPFDLPRHRLLLIIPQKSQRLTTLKNSPELAQIATSMCMKIFRGSFLRKEDIHFTTGYFCEDVMPSMAAICRASHILLMNETYYFYRQDRPGQRTKEINSSSGQLVDVLASVMTSTDLTSAPYNIRCRMIGSLTQLVLWTRSLLPKAEQIHFMAACSSLFREAVPGDLRAASGYLRPGTSASLWLWALSNGTDMASRLAGVADRTKRGLWWLSNSLKAICPRYPLSENAVAKLISQALQPYMQTGQFTTLRVLPGSDAIASSVMSMMFPQIANGTPSRPLIVTSAQGVGGLKVPPDEGRWPCILYLTSDGELLDDVHLLLSALAETYLVANMKTGWVQHWNGSPVDVSVIVPVWGVENYVGKCVESLRSQIFSGRMEVLFINDGSPDRSVDIIRQASEGLPHFRVIDKPNGGAADARNLGINEARGRYLCFVDGDDYVASDYVQRLYSLISNAGTDIAQAAFVYADAETGILTANKDCMPLSGGGIARGIDVMRNVPGIWRRIYNRDFILSNKLFFNSIFRRHDDLPFNIHTLLRAGGVAVSHEPVYHYVVGRPGQDVSATDERMFIHFRLFDDVLSDDVLYRLNRRDFATFIKVMFSHHLWAYTRLEPSYREHYLPGFSYQLFLSDGRISPLCRLAVLLVAFKEQRHLLWQLYRLHRRVTSADIITDLDYAQRVDYSASTCTGTPE